MERQDALKSLAVALGYEVSEHSKKRRNHALPCAQELEKRAPDWATLEFIQGLLFQALSSSFSVLSQRAFAIEMWMKTASALKSAPDYPSMLDALYRRDWSFVCKACIALLIYPFEYNVSKRKQMALDLLTKIRDRLQVLFQHVFSVTPAEYYDWSAEISSSDIPLENVIGSRFEIVKLLGSGAYGIAFSVRPKLGFNMPPSALKIQRTSVRRLVEPRTNKLAEPVIQAHITSVLCPERAQIFDKSHAVSMVRLYRAYECTDYMAMFVELCPLGDLVDVMESNTECYLTNTAFCFSVIAHVICTLIQFHRGFSLVHNDSYLNNWFCSVWDDPHESDACFQYKLTDTLTVSIPMAHSGGTLPKLGDFSYASLVRTNEEDGTAERVCSTRSTERLSAHMAGDVHDFALSWISDVFRALYNGRIVAQDCSPRVLSVLAQMALCTGCYETEEKTTIASTLSAFLETSPLSNPSGWESAARMAHFLMRSERDCTLEAPRIFSLFETVPELARYLDPVDTQVIVVNAMLVY